MPVWCFFLNLVLNWCHLTCKCVNSVSFHLKLFNILGYCVLVHFQNANFMIIYRCVVLGKVSTQFAGNLDFGILLKPQITVSGYRIDHTFHILALSSKFYG